MEKKTLMLCAILTIFTILIGIDFAQAATFSVSCTVPSIAGVNAPMVEEKAMRAQEAQQAPQPQVQVATLPKDIKTPVTSMLQTEQETQMPTAAPMLVKTFYSR